MGPKIPGGAPAYIQGTRKERFSFPEVNLNAGL